ncbi:MAG TPA: RHS repeat-associated core domain-containing protein, partial [Flavobacterium sp.]|nr:RHS repeat-associated core domain-containing protein [Flavobacterium sp.]
NGLAVTANDGIKTTSSVKNANGHVISSTDPGGTIYYAYYANGNLKESDYEGNKVRMEYDEWGRKKLLSDPSAGTYRYKYYPSGETYQEQTPKGTTTYILDPAGKLTEKQIEGDLTSTIIAYTYDPATKLLRFMDAFDNFHGFGQTVEYIYDSKQRLKQTWENNMDFYYQKDIEYDSFGRAEKELTFAYHNETGKSTSKKIRNTYKNGTHWQILDDASGQVLWQANTVNARGQLLAASLGNGIAIENAYDAYGLPSLIKHDRTGPGASNVMALATSFNAQRGNLMSRSSSLFGWNENFRYDSLDRLTHFTSQHGNQEIQKYDAKGRIAENNAGRYAYSSSESPYRNTSVALNPAGAAYYANREGLFNDSMEEDRDWNKNSVDLSRISYDNSKSKTGAYSLKISTTPINVNYVHSSKLIPIDNAVPTSYTFSGWAYSVNSTAQIVLFMYNADETGYYTQVEHVSTGVTNAWTYIEATVAVPASIKKLGIRADNLGTGTVWFDDIRIKKTANAPTEQRELNISYNALQDPVHIEETGVDKISFFYNGLDSRNAIYYGGLQDDIYKRASRKYYSNAGDVEIKFSRSSGKVEFTQFIGGDGYTAPLLLRSDGTAQQYLYLHRDYQGTILAITDQAANIVEKRLFDAWGNIAKVQDGQGNDLAGLTILDRGYTGHEHLQSVGLVHMNGRLYDARLRRFLQADNFVQEPHNTQNYNRYGYVLNNPLKYTDPSGEEFTMLAAVLIGAAIGAASYTITALTADVPFTAGGFLKSAVMGAISGAVTNGIGSYAESIKQLGSRIVFQALAHAFFQGTVSGVQGGNFWTGFASGAISSLVSSAWGGGKMEKSNTAWKGLGGNWGHSDFGTIAFGTVSGGAGAALTGGNFWQGAATGLTVSLLNHVVHKIDQRSTLLSRFKNKALAFQKADVSDEGIATLHQNVEGLVEGYKAGNSPTHSYDLVGNDYVAITENGNVSLNKGLISSKNNLYFAGLLFHEYRHAFQYSAPYTIGGKRYANRFDAWTEFYGSGYKGEGGVWNMMELDAYSAQYRFGDNQPYVSERINKYYSNMLNIWKK